MAKEKTQTTIIVAVVILVAALVFGGLALLVLKFRAHLTRQTALATLKAENPVEYYVLHTPLAQNEEELKHALAGTWKLAGAKSLKTGDFVQLEPGGSYYFKSFTLTNWTMVAYDAGSNLLYSAGGQYTLQGDRDTEYIENATGAKTQFLGSRPQFRIRVDGDNFYQMGAGENPSIEQWWQRVGE